MFVVIWMVATTINLPGDGELDTKARETLALINQERQQAGIAPLHWDVELASMAKKHSQFMSDTNIFEHSDYGYAENIAQGGTGSANELYVLWKYSPGHHANYMDNRWHYAGIGITYKVTSIKLGSRVVTINVSNGYATFLAR